MLLITSIFIAQMIMICQIDWLVTDDTILCRGQFTKYVIQGGGEEWLYFSSAALRMDCWVYKVFWLSIMQGYECAQVFSVFEQWLLEALLLAKNVHGLQHRGSIIGSKVIPTASIHLYAVHDLPLDRLYCLTLFELHCLCIRVTASSASVTYLVLAL